MKIHRHNKEAFSIYDFLEKDECDSLIDRAERIGFQLSSINDGMSQSRDSSIRNNQRIIFDDPELSGKLYGKLHPALATSSEGWEPFSINERWRFYKYEKYQTFKWHRDMPFRRTPREHSKQTFMVYLNDNFEGGFTEFDDIKIWPQTGMALCFNHKVRHQGSYVTQGTKYVLRSDIMYKYTNK